MALAKQADHYEHDLMAEMKTVSEHCGVGYGKQLSDFLALRSAGTGLSFEEYLRYRLFGKPRAEYGAYMGDDRARAAFLIANQLTSWDAAEDKLYFSTLVSGAGLPTPELVAVCHPARDAAGAQALRSESDVAQFLSACPTPIFGKPVIAAHGNRTIMIVARDGGELKTGDGERHEIEMVAREIVEAAGAAGFIFQEALRPHGQIAALTDNRLATARFLVFLDQDGPAIRHCVLRIPAAGHYVDSFQRPGNLIAAVDVETGALGPARRGAGAASETVAAHPDSGVRIEGLRVPDFAAAREIVRKGAQIYPGLRLQSWDVAFTDKGPSLVEVNPGGNFFILQMANGRGVFDPEFRAFLARCVSANPGAKANARAFRDAKKLLKLK